MSSEKTYDDMDKISVELAEATANRVYLAEFRKSKKAILMKEAEAKSPGISAAAQEREAYASPEYVELLEGLKSATEIEVYTRHKLKILEMRFEAWRSKQATARTEMGLR